MKIVVPAPGFTPEERFSQLHAISRRAGADVANEYAGYVDRDDMAQEALAWFYEHPGVVDAETDDEGRMYSQRLVRKVKRYLLPLARRERTYRNGGKVSDDARYTPDTVRVVLPAVWTGESAERVESEVRVAANPAEGNTWAAMVLDVRAALHASLGKADQALLFAHYVTGDSWEQVAASRGSTEGAVQKRASRAVAVICDHLNGLEPDTDLSWGGPGSRRVLSNGTAQAITQNAYYLGDV